MLRISFPPPQHEVDLCRRECPFVIKPKVQRPPAAALPEGEEMETDMEGEEKGRKRSVTPHHPPSMSFVIPLMSRSPPQ